ncbi:hypothetical protein H5410_033009 [Solanum commersonii]|uniref:Uncharacterized protein n=1 Tax=Solanum commersonii TaxID=4109 RepID=A0A9J5YPH6_SOLCO|nr:hypothetical protein H5410_033009 [Solanum commersonii]
MISYNTSPRFIKNRAMCIACSGDPILWDYTGYVVVVYILSSSDPTLRFITLGLHLSIILEKD